MGRKANLELLHFCSILVVSTASSAGYREVQEFLVSISYILLYFFVKKNIKN